jgi:hypothetical protein
MLPFGFRQTRSKSEHLSFFKKKGTSHNKTVVSGFDMGSTNFGTGIYERKTVQNARKIILISGQTFFGVRIYPILRYNRLKLPGVAYCIYEISYNTFFMRLSWWAML